MNVTHRAMTVSGRPTKFDAHLTQGAFDDARLFLEVFADKPEAALDQLLHYNEGRIWKLGEALCATTSTTCLELEGVYAMTDLTGPDGARDLIIKWIANARDAIARHREQGS